MPSCPHCGVTSESAPVNGAAEAISAHVRECPANPVLIQAKQEAEQARQAREDGAKRKRAR